MSSLVVILRWILVGESILFKTPTCPNQVAAKIFPRSDLVLLVGWDFKLFKSFDDIHNDDDWTRNWPNTRTKAFSRRKDLHAHYHVRFELVYAWENFRIWSFGKYRLNFFVSVSTSSNNMRRGYIIAHISENFKFN